MQKSRYEVLNTLATILAAILNLWNAKSLQQGRILSCRPTTTKTYIKFAYDIILKWPPLPLRRVFSMAPILKMFILSSTIANFHDFTTFCTIWPRICSTICYVMLSSTTLTYLILIGVYNEDNIQTNWLFKYYFFNLHVLNNKDHYHMVNGLFVRIVGYLSYSNMLFTTRHTVASLTYGTGARAETRLLSAWRSVVCP